jgi:hypothetical protein
VLVTVALGVSIAAGLLRRVHADEPHHADARHGEGVAGDPLTHALRLGGHRAAGRQRQRDDRGDETTVDHARTIASI